MIFLKLIIDNNKTFLTASFSEIIFIDKLNVAVKKNLSFYCVNLDNRILKLKVIHIYLLRILLSFFL